MIGNTLAHYRITDKLGEGGMGEVYLAEDTRLKRQVALKVLPADLAADPERLARFQREAEMVAALNHPSIVTLFSVEEHEGVHFLTMELVDGRSLAEVIPSAGLGIDQIFDIAIPLADALATAHEKGIVHRDLKPANVMVTPTGRVKILDFGLAKLTGAAAEGEDDDTEALTQEGKILGTVPYMSPEQVQGKPLDARSDVFSLGAMLYEMATGRRPFGGATSADLISAILRDDPSSITELKGELPYHLGRIVRHCLEKDPQRRFRSALDVRNELEDLQKELRTGPLSETVVLDAVAGRRARKPRWLPALAALAAALLAGWLAWRLLTREATPIPIAAPEPTVAAAPEQPSIAVLYFDNLSGDEDLDWLRRGLTDMLVTDLSQSPDLRVLSTDRLHQILADMKKLDERITSFEVVRQVAAQASADKVILGSFAKLGDTIRISIKVQEAATGEILESDSVDAGVREDIFARVDDLSRNIRQSIALPARPAAAADRNLAEVSTASVEAYKAFVEAEELHYQSREPEALELYRRAAEIDPTFAMAWAKLATAHGNLGMEEEAQRYAERAMQHLDRLTEIERAYVEGRYYGRTLETVPRAIETYETALRSFPYETSLLNNVGVLYGQLGMYGEQITMLEKSIAYGDRFPGTHTSLANAYVATGDRARALEVLDEFLREAPDAVSAYQTLAVIAFNEGDIPAGERALRKAEEVRPGYFALLFSELSLAILKDDWQQAEDVRRRVADLPFPFARSAAAGLGAGVALYQGSFDRALELGRESLAAWGESPSSDRAGSHVNMAAVLLQAGEPESALEHARAAREDDRGNIADFVGQGIEALAYEKLGQSRRADLLLAELEQRIEPLPGPALRAWGHEVRGRLALERGRTDEAVVELEAAARQLPVRSDQEARVWYQLAEAYEAAGRTADAERRYRLITDLAGTRLFNPVEYIGSHFRLGRLLEQRGDLAGARAAYQKYLSYWGAADQFGDDVEHARTFLAEA